MQLVYAFVSGATYHRIGEMFEAQPREDLNPLVDSMWLYKGLLDTLPDIWHVSRVVNLFSKLSSKQCYSIFEKVVGQIVKLFR